MKINYIKKQEHLTLVTLKLKENLIFHLDF